MTDKIVDDYHQKVKKLESELNKDNAHYMNDLKGYLLLSTFLYDEDKVTEDIYLLYLDVLEAQKEGLAAQDYLGKNPKEMADQLIQGYPKMSRKTFFYWMIRTLVLYYLIVCVSHFLLDGQVSLKPWSLLIDSLAVPSLLLFVMAQIKRSIYFHSLKSTLLIYFLLSGGLILFFLGKEWLLRETWTIVLSSGASLTLVAILAVVVGMYMLSKYLRRR